jgi:hypothetical protein
MWAKFTSGLAFVLCFAVGTRPAHAEVDAEKVRKAIETGIAYLQREQRNDGSWPDHPGMPGGISSLCALALLTAGVPKDDAKIQAALNSLRKKKFDLTYTISLQTMVLCAADPKKDLLLIRENVKKLESLQKSSGDKKGAWGYRVDQGAGDNSNSQFALLALHEAERVGVPVSEQTWRLASAYWERTQNADGSWGYMEGLAGTGSMTCAGIAAMVIAGEKLNPGDADVNGDVVHCCGQQESNDAVEKAMAWLSRNFSVHSNPGAHQTWLLYYLYGVERAGRLTNQRFIGGHDWYREGAELLVRNQVDPGGFWKGLGHAEENEHIATSLALLFLAKGRRPILVAKLKHEPRDDWNRHRTDLANLTNYVEKQWKRDLTWQIVDAAHATPDDLIQSPVLFLSGKFVPELTDAQVKNLREYINQGGFLFAEACCGGKEFDTGFRTLMKRVFPEPEHPLLLLDPDHPVWHAEEQVDPKFAINHPLWGVNIGCRTSVVYCPENLGCYWELGRLGREDKLPPSVRSQVNAARSIGINVLAYATNRELKYKLDELPRTAKGPVDPFERGKIFIAKIQHGGGWNVAPGALPNLMREIASVTGLRFNTDQRQLGLADAQVFNYHMIFLHGRNAFQFNEAERKNLREYVNRGGMVFADAVCASEAFARSFRNEMATIFPDSRLARIPITHPLFSQQFGGFPLNQELVTRREPNVGAGPLKAAQHKVEPDLEGLEVGPENDRRLGVIFSPYDLSCALEHHESLECPGYIHVDAAKIGLNVVMYSLHE